MNSADRERILLRFWKYVNKTDGCWLWTGQTSRKGYGYFLCRRKKVKAHRFAYETFVGRLEPGMTIDHVVARGCTSKSCVRPDHLEQVDVATNIRRGGNSAKTHCPRGHEYAHGNLVRCARKERRCRACVRRAYTTTLHVPE